MSERYLTGKQAAQALGISTATLYSYVSRGMIRSEMIGKDKRHRRYHAEDIDRLLLKRQTPEKWVEAALDWGAPVLDSAITLIADNKLYYRGQDAVQLAQERSFEEVAALIWTGDLATPLTIPPLDEEVLAQVQSFPLDLVSRMQLALQIAGASDLAAYDVRPAAVVQTGTRILYLLAALIAGEGQGAIATRLQQAWCPDQPAAAPILNAALILCADHELNASSFTARVIASAGSTPYAALIGAFSAFQGVKHGGMTDRVEAFLRDIPHPAQARQIIAEKMRRGEMLPGFGHRLYPQGDPRALALLDKLNLYAPQSEAVQLAREIIPLGQQLIGEPPSIDFALAVMSRVLALPPGSGMTIFALGRVVGWIGQIIEQFADQRLIRPRARYVGIPPE